MKLGTGRARNDKAVSLLRRRGLIVVTQCANWAPDMRLTKPLGFSGEGVALAWCATHVWGTRRTCCVVLTSFPDMEMLR